MPVKVVNFQAKVCGDTKDITMHNFIERNLTFKLVNNPLTLIEIPDVEKNVFPTLKKMYPEEFGSKEIIEIMDRIDQVCLDEKKKLGPLLSDEYKEGFEACRSVMQDEMNLIEDEIKKGWTRCPERK